MTSLAFSFLQAARAFRSARHCSWQGREAAAGTAPWGVRLGRALLCTIAEDVLVRSAASEVSSKLKELISKCKGLNEDRVRIVHGLWYVGGQEGRLIRSSRGQAKAKVHYGQADEVAGLADRANQYRAELEQLVHYMPPIGRRPSRLPEP